MLTAIAAALRLWNLSYPPLLWDEAATYTRVTGTFGELVSILRFDGFAPLHYELYWLMARMMRMTPWQMRIVPAIAGIAMVPAIYFLAREVTSRKVALIAAGMATFSAYLLVYSRDAKMYMHLWLCATLCVACLLWWMRTGKRIAWLCLVLAATAMNGLHALGLCVIGVCVVIVLLHPRVTWNKFAAALAGLAIACSALAVHYVYFNQWGREIEQGGWRKSGLDWVGQRNRQFSKPFLLWDTAASWLVAYRSPRPPVTAPRRVIVPAAIMSGVLIALFALGWVRWRRELRDDDPEDVYPGTRGAMWMAAWVLLPAVGFFVVSFGFGKDVWNARYLAVAWPAVVVLLAMAFQRLPHPALRAGAIALFVGANVLQFALRMAVENGVPVDLVARDLADRNATTIVLANDDPAAPSLGGNGGIFDFPGKYYLSLETNVRLRPRQLRDEPTRDHFVIPTRLDEIPADAERVVVWRDGTEPASLGKKWKRISMKEHAVRDFWCWRRMFRCTRSEFVRQGNGSSSPEYTGVTWEVVGDQMVEVRLILYALATAAADEPFAAGRLQCAIQFSGEDVLQSAHYFVPGRISAPTENEVGMDGFVPNCVESVFAAFAEVTGDADDQSLDSEVEC